MTYKHIMKKIKEADVVMLELNDHDKDYDTALELFDALSNTAKYMKLYLKKKLADGVQLTIAEMELNEYMATTK